MQRSTSEIIWKKIFYLTDQDDIKSMSKFHFSQLNLSKKLTKIVVLVALSLGLLLSSFYVVIDYFQQKTFLNTTIEQIVAVSMPSVIEVAYKLDKEGADKIARGLLEYGYIVEVAIMDELDNVLAQKKAKKKAPSSTAWLTKLISDDYTKRSVVLRDPLMPETLYGTLYFTVNNDLALRPFYKRSMTLLLSGVLQNLILTAVLLCVFYLLLTKPLNKIARGLAHIKPEAVDGARIESLPLHKNDELGEIVMAANQFFENNEHHLKKSQQADKEKKMLEQQLHQSQKMEAIGTLAGGIAHDFNNLLAIIVGFAEMAKDSIPKSNPAIRDINEILNTSNRAKELVEQILAFSRKSAPQKTYLNLGLLVEQALTLLRSSIPKKIDLQSDISAKGTTVFADTSQVIQIILNLCTNAAQAMENTGGILKVSLKRVASLNQTIKNDSDKFQGPYLCLTVSDTGKGIDKSTLEKMFDPYFTTKEFGKGTGMGLAMVHGIVKSHEGIIEVDSKPGAGSTFNVYLPQAEPQPEANVNRY